MPTAQGSVHAILTFLSSALPLPPLLEAMFSEVTIILVFTLVVLDYDYPIIIIIVIIIIIIVRRPPTRSLVAVSLKCC